MTKREKDLENQVKKLERDVDTFEIRVIQKATKSDPAAGDEEVLKSIIFADKLEDAMFEVAGWFSEALYLKKLSDITKASVSPRAIRSELIF